MKKIAVVRIRGNIGLPRPVKDTLKKLRLYKANYCAILPNTPEAIGMLDRVKDYVTWGEVDSETIKSLLNARGRLPSNKPLQEEYMKEKTKMSIDEFSKSLIEGKKSFKDVPGLKPFFRLKPPTGGFERKGIKKQYSLGGSLGYRREKMNDLIKKMI